MRIIFRHTATRAQIERVEQLLRRLLPGEAQVARHRHQPQPNRPTGREQQRPRIAIGATFVVALGGEIRGEDVVHVRAVVHHEHHGRVGIDRPDARGVDVAEPHLLFELDPCRQRLGRLPRVQGHVVHRVFPLAAEEDATAEPAGVVEPLDLLAREPRALGTDLREQRQRFLAAGPLLEHLRRRLDEVALDRGAALGDVVGLREDPVQDVAELVHQRLELVVVEALAVEVGDQRRERRAARQHARAADRERGGVVVLAFARVEIQVEAGHELPGLAVEHVEVAHVGMPRRDLALDELHER